MMDFVEKEKREIMKTIREMADVAVKEAFEKGYSRFGKGLHACSPKGSHMSFHVEVRIDDNRPISHRRVCSE
jgi:hypothetical protein